MAAIGDWLEQRLAGLIREMALEVSTKMAAPAAPPAPVAPSVELLSEVPIAPLATLTPFDKAFEIIIGSEGGYVNNPDDPGGETKYGISKRAYPNLDIKNLTLDTAKTIYRRDYWNHVDADALPAGLALLVFDAAVNSGPHAAAVWLQAAVGAAQDGVVGPKTIAAVTAKGADATSAEMLALRITSLAGLSTWKTFGLGWSRRVCRLPYQEKVMV